MRNGAGQWRQQAADAIGAGLVWIRRHRKSTAALGLLFIILGMVLTVIGQRLSVG
jgi:hypothetical protein